MTATATICNSEFTTLIVCAFRYALGRKTYVVSSIVGTIHNCWQDLSEDTRDLFVREIREYKEKFGSLGHQCDENDWMTIVQRRSEEILA